MSDLSRSERFRRLQRRSDGPFPALTVLEARRFLREYPDFGPAWLLLGIALIELARYEEAEQSLGKAIELAPSKKQCIPLWHMGHLFRNCGDYEQSAKWYRQAIEATPDDATGYIFLGAVLARQGRLHEAEEAYRTGAACREGCVDEAFYNLGNVLRARERFDGASECYREAIRLDPNYRIAKQALRDAQLCSKLRRTRKRR